ncbi:MAG: glycoside hydrolase family 9 protein [Balneolaceae bacterium]
MKKHLVSFSFGLILLLLSSPLFAQSTNDKPKVNQIGYYPDGPKIAITPEIEATTFFIKRAEDESIAFEGELISGGTNEFSGEEVKIADFTEFREAGFFILEIQGGESSFPFGIGDNTFEDVTDGVMKAYYFMRASTALEAEYAGKWARNLGHADDDVIVHNSAASENRPTDSRISAPKGWYDAGDYNKYVVNSGISTYTLLFAYEQFPEFFDDQNLNIPESDNDIPDILDEALWNLRWLLKMQDPDDGGVYHKLTHANFTGAVMPSATNNIARYVVQKTSAATFDFAAMMAQAARVFEPFLPDFADSALAAAEEAWQWGLDNPAVYYNQGELQNPAINTGAYGDGNVTDEQFWAASELYITTGEESYYDDEGWKDNEIENPGWNNVRALGLYSLIHHRKNLTPAAFADTTAMKQKLVNSFSLYMNDAASAPYRSSFGLFDWQFNWGSNGGAGNLGMALLQVFQVTGDSLYYDGAIHVLDYLLGRNPVDYSYITGFGDQTPMNIHHRPSEADNVNDPVPGLVAGGPNPGNQYDCEDNSGYPDYPSDLPAVSYLDHWCSYSTNEITINWNAPAVYLLSGLQALTPTTGLVVTNEQQGSVIPDKFQLQQNYPNPFNSTTNIEFSLKEAGFIRLDVYEVNGRHIQELISEKKTRESLGNF